MIYIYISLCVHISTIKWMFVSAWKKFGLDYNDNDHGGGGGWSKLFFLKY